MDRHQANDISESVAETLICKTPLDMLLEMLLERRQFNINLLQILSLSYSTYLYLIQLRVLSHLNIETACNVNELICKKKNT